MNGKAFTILNTESFDGIFSGSWLLKHWKIRIAYRQWHSNFPRKGGNQITERKTESYVFDGFGNGQLEDLPQSDFGRVPERLLLLVRTKSITESFVHWKLCQWFDFVAFQRIFSSWALASTHFTISFGDCRSFCFHSLIKLTFHCQQRAVVFIWLTQEYMVACWYGIFVRVFNSNRNFISTRAHV